MPRTLRDLDPNGGTLARFAQELRTLREKAGNPKFATMERRVGRSKSTLAEAVSGRHLPRWETVADFVRACGADPAPWRARWNEVRRELGPAGSAGPTESTTPVDPSADSAAAGWAGTAVPEVAAVRDESAGGLVTGPVGSGPASRPASEGQSIEPDPTSELSDSETGPSAAARPRRAARPVRRIAIAAVAALVLLATGYLAATVSAADVASPALRAIEIQNKVALGEDQLVEDRSPAYLSSIPVAYCARPDRSCKVAGTEMGSGAAVVAHCSIHGQKMWNYNLSEPAASANPDRASSDLWYRASFPDGRSGFISEVYLTAGSRGGLDLPACSPSG